jgi:hypothetical protein
MRHSAEIQEQIVPLFQPWHYRERVVQPSITALSAYELMNEFPIRKIIDSLYVMDKAKHLV